MQIVTRQHSLESFFAFYVLVGFVWIIFFYFWPTPGGFFSVPINFIYASTISLVAHLLYWFRKR